MSLLRLVMARGPLAVRAAAPAARMRMTHSFSTTLWHRSADSDSGDSDSWKVRGSTACWQDDYVGMSAQPFPTKLSKVLMAPLEAEDIEIKPDGMLYLPEIKYRRVLNSAFGPGGWGMKPLSPHMEKEGRVSREYGLYCQGRFTAQATGEHSGSIVGAAAAESAKSNALMRCCKDIGIASELWDPQFILDWKKQYTVAVWCVNQRSGDKRKLWRRKDRPAFDYPWKEGDAGAKRNAPPTPVSAQPVDPPAPPPPSPPPSSSGAPADIPFTSTVVEDASFGGPLDFGAGGGAAGAAGAADVEMVRGVSVEGADDVETFMDEAVPNVMKKFRNSTWREVANTKPGLNYLEWASRSFSDPKVASMAAAMVEYKNSGK